jgi:hypothetical protein
MTMKVEDHALIGDTHTAALVRREGSFGLVDAYALSGGRKMLVGDMALTAVMVAHSMTSTFTHYQTQRRLT